MSKNLSNREKILLLIFTILLLVLGYFKLFYEPTQERIDNYNSMTISENSQSDILQPRIMSMRKMQKVIDEVKDSGRGKSIPAYNNERSVIRELNRILAQTREYSLTFGQISKDDYIINRPISMSFTTGTYQEARRVIDDLTNCELINQIDNVSINRYIVRDRYYNNLYYDDYEYYTVSISIVFYEMVS